MPLKKLEVYLFALGGSIRNSSAGAVRWEPALAGGFGVNLKLTHAVGSQAIPGKYVASYLPNGNWQNSDTARAGFVFTSFKKHS